MKARTIIGVGTIAVLLAVAIYLLCQIPLVFAIGGIVALVGALLAIGIDEPDAL
jgi:hypothetical protein